MKNPPGIVRWLPLVLAAAACSTEVATAPELDSSLLVTAAAKGGGTGEAVFEPSRYIQSRLYGVGELIEYGTPNPSAFWRSCQLNSYEDRDGNDFVVTGTTYRKEHVNEGDGFVMILQGPTYGSRRPVAIGRASWAGQMWFNTPYVNDPDADQVLVRIMSQGVVFPVKYNDDGSFVDREVADLLGWLNQMPPDSVPGAWTQVNGEWIPQKSGVGYDLLNDPLGVIPAHPDPSMVGTVGRAVYRINALLKKYEAELVGTECDADYDLVGYNGYDPLYWVKHNDIVFTKTWPNQLKRLF